MRYTSTLSVIFMILDFAGVIILKKKRNETDRLEYKVPPYFHSPKIIQVASVDIDFQKTNWQ